MRNKLLFSFFATAVGIVPTAYGDFAITGQSPLAVHWNGSPLIAKSTFEVDGEDRMAEPAKRNTVAGTSGVTVYNVENAAEGRCFRQEAAVNADGDLEISFQTRFDAYTPETEKELAFKLYIPYSVVENMQFKGITGRISGPKEREGVLASDLAGAPGEANYRYFALTDGQGNDLVFDFNATGMSDYISDWPENSVRGLWDLKREGDYLVVSISTKPAFYGGTLTGKVKIFEGKFEDYDSRHALRSYSWGEVYKAEHLFCFGADRHGDNYTNAGLLPYNSGRGYGWKSNTALTVRPSGFEGAYYTSVSGKDGVFEVTGLRKGLYFITVGSGNAAGIANAFSATVNGEEFFPAMTVAKAEAVISTLPVWVENGKVEVSFNGDFLLSTLGLQYMLAATEDITIKRGFWLSEGYEPSVLWSNQYYREPAGFQLSQERIFLPEPGKEAVGEPRNPPAPVNVLDAKAQPKADWRYRAVISTFGPNNAGSLAEFPGESLDRRMQQLQNDNVNVILVNGMLSRHTYSDHMPRAQKELKRIVESARKHAIKVVDHQDLTLCWNVDAGIRQAAFRTAELQKMYSSQMPSPYFCFNNPRFAEHYDKYIADFVKNTDIDGYMLDETMMMDHSCACGFCREKFHADTGFYLPVNELDPRLEDNSSKLKRVWMKWRAVQVGNWFTRLRAAIDTVKPEVALVCYTTHYGYISKYASWGYAADLTQIARGADFLGTEITTRNVYLGHRAVFALRKAKNLLRIAYGNPVWGLISANGHWDVNYFGWAINNMNGQPTWANDPMVMPDGKSNYFRFADRNMNLKEAEPVAEVAVLFSAAARDWGGGFSPSSEALGTAQTLGSMQIPYNIIGEMSLTPDALAGYKVLMLGSTSTFSDEQLQVIKDFAKNGGRVFLTTTAGWENDFGEARTTWGFADVFGFEPPRRTARRAELLDHVDGTTFSLKQPLYEVDVDLTQAANPAELLPSPATRNPDGSIEKLLVTVPHGEGRFYYLKSSCAIPLCAAEGYVGNPWEFDLDEKLDAVFKETLSEIVGDAAWWKNNLPEGFLSTVYRQGDTYVIHVLNASGAKIAFGETVPYGTNAIDFPQPLEDLKFTLPIKSVGKVYAVSPDFEGRKELNFTRNGDGTATVVLPKNMIHIYTVIFMEPQAQ